ncbi:hypothetical protein QBC46DRAFT_110223 [Diplogelasinospora grovesii]|uniref:Uncharacterized protein n=1 Tax=Diplogelasinospora grovesii TaxID=303347 RepID=A0AAN6N8I9_9PEZI|nr:hypothetical protein QBC46DRAFT_110223 [Diplogelasinospora grovesii]
MFVNQPNMQSQEELSALFARNLTLNPVVQQHLAPAPAPEPQQEEKKIVYISQHYNHSAHLVASQPQSPRPASEPPQLEHSAVERVLRNYGVDPSGLSAAQLQLFKTVDTPQQLKLMELWRVCPPTNSNNNPTLAWNSTTVQQEEVLAKLRYDDNQRQQQQQQQETIMSLDGTPLTPIQAGDGRWVTTMVSSHYMEPYMASGYEEMARREYEESARRALAEAHAMEQSKEIYSLGSMPTPGYNPAHADPVYNRNTMADVEWRRQEAMADQYGRMMAMRGDQEMR